MVPVIKSTLNEHYYDVILDPYLILVKDEVDNILYPSGSCNKKYIGVTLLDVTLSHQAKVNSSNRLLEK